jgi:uncharacterized membrane protein
MVYTNNLFLHHEIMHKYMQKYVKRCVYMYICIYEYISVYLYVNNLYNSTNHILYSYIILFPYIGDGFGGNVITHGPGALGFQLKFKNGRGSWNPF